MKNFQFTLILSGVAEITPELADAMYVATGGDIELNMCNDVAFLEFDRDADSLEDAVHSAITQVEGTDVGVRVVRVESAAANTLPRSTPTYWALAVDDRMINWSNLFFTALLCVILAACFVF